MRKILLLTLSLSVLLCCSGAALAFTIDDTAPVPYTELERWTSGKVVGGGYTGDGVFQDVLAANNEFATDSIKVNFNPFTIQIWTNNQPGGYVVSGTNFGVADLAINAGPATAAYDGTTIGHFGAISSPFELGIDMQAYAAGTPGQGGAGNAPLVNVGMWTTSFAIVNPTAGFQYGGGYRPAGAVTPGISPVEILLSATSQVMMGNMNWVVNDAALDPKNAIPDYLITIAFGQQFAPGFELLWGTAECGNDIVHEPSVVPLPGALLLLGAGLVRLVAYRRKKVSLRS